MQTKTNNCSTAKLLRRSALAAAATLIIGSMSYNAFAEIVYMDIPDTVVKQSSEGFDLDNDGVNELNIEHSASTGGDGYTDAEASIQILNYGDDVFFILPSTYPNQVAFFAAGDSIDYSTGFYSTNGISFLARNRYDNGRTTEGQWYDNNSPVNGYIGFALYNPNTDDNDRFGWIRISVEPYQDGNDDSLKVTVYELAYENTPFQPIIAGDKGTPPNSPPTAEAGENQSIHAGETVQLSGIGSTDLETDAQDLIYDWSFNSLPAGSTPAFDYSISAAEPSFIADMLGTYEIKLTVTDEGGLENSDTVTVTTENVPPQADAGLDQTMVVNESVTLDGTGSSDTDDDSLSYEWTLLESPTGSTAVLSDANTASPSFTTDEIGSYEFQLVVNDGFEDSEPATVSVNAINAADFALITLRDVMNYVEGLPNPSFQGPVQRQTRKKLISTIAKAIRDIQRNHINTTVHLIDKMIERNDGCTLRGSPDPFGSSIKTDWIIDCTAQQDVYSGLLIAKGALQP